MPDDISVQILSQTSDNIQKLFDLSTRIDERVKAIQSKQEQLDRRIDETIRQHIDLMQKIAVLEAKAEDAGDEELYPKIIEIDRAINELDKRMSHLENEQGHHSERWKGIANFVIQLVWVILAAYLLTRLNLQPPVVP